MNQDKLFQVKLGNKCNSALNKIKSGFDIETDAKAMSTLLKLGKIIMEMKSGEINSIEIFDKELILKEKSKDSNSLNWNDIPDTNAQPVTDKDVFGLGSCILIFIGLFIFISSITFITGLDPNGKGFDFSSQTLVPIATLIVGFYFSKRCKK